MVGCVHGRLTGVAVVSVAAGLVIMSDSDVVLVVRVQRGDKAAFDLLVLKYQHKIHSLISRYIRDHAEVQDVAQEAFIKAYRAMGKFRSESSFYTWMYRIAINTAKNHLVARSRRPPATCSSTTCRSRRSLPKTSRTTPEKTASG